MIKNIILIAILLFSTIQISSIEKCFLKIMRGEVTSEYSQDASLFDTDENILRMITTDYQSIPTDVQNQLKSCGKALEDQSCEVRFGQEQCENCGISRVKKCGEGFIRFDCLSCIRICPKGTQSYAGGALCIKPKITKRKLFNTKEACLVDNKVCREDGGMYPSDCLEDFKPLGRLRCTYDCPEGFVDGVRYCIPEKIENSITFTLKFEQDYKRMISAEK